MATFDTDEISRNFAVLDELETSAKLIRLGFGELQNLNQSNDFYFLPFQLLSQGFERLMKSYICLGHLDKNKKYPLLPFVKDLGHDLEKLMNVILKDYFIVKTHPTLLADKEFLQNDRELRELLFILSEFGKLARYHNYDIITGNQKPSVNPKDLWTKFEHKILFSNPSTKNKLMDWELHNEIYGELSSHILIIFEKFVSALSRQFLFDGIGEKGKQYSNSVFDFAMLYSKDFGKKDYRQNTTRYKETPKKIHKRNFIDTLQRKYNPDYKSKRVTKADFQGAWPFYANEVVIECRQKNWCIVTIDGYDYSLNGSAKRRYKFENVHDAGMAILGKGTGDFIKMALDL
jgi:hypothetical protein